MSGKSLMSKFVLRNIVQQMVSCSYFCVFYLMILCMLDTAGIGADKMPQEDISVVTELNDAAGDSSGTPTDGKAMFPSEIGFVHAFVASFTVIIVSELGDKTFFIAAIMAMRHPRLTVFAGAIIALALMTVLSVVFGMAATIIPRVYTYYISTALFALFGLKMLREGYYMSASEGAEELEEVQSDLRKRDDELMRSLNGNRKETVELVPLGAHDDAHGPELVHKPVGHTGAIANGSIHSLVSNHDLVATHQHQTMRLSSSASQLQSMMTSGAGPGHHQHHLNGGSVSSINRKPGSTTLAGGGRHGSSKSLTVALAAAAADGTTGNDSSTLIIATSPGDTGDGRGEQRQRTRGGQLAANGSLGTGGPLPDGSNDVTVAGSTGGAGGILTQSKMLERETSAMTVQDAETGVIRKTKQRSAMKLLLRIFMQAFTMTFLAEWGDRSQLTTIILSARENVYGVIAGGIIGHSICTGLAVIGGRMIAQKISVRTVTLIGGVVFLVFAVSALFFSPEEEPMKINP